MPKIEELEHVVLELPHRERAKLARVLLLSLDGVLEEATERVWAEEGERRYQEIASGKVDALASEEVFREARERRTGITSVALGTGPVA